MRFTLLTFSALILLIWHQALAFPGALPPTPNTEVTVWNLPRTAPYDPATRQILDSRATDVKATADLDTRSLQARAIPWASSELKRRLVVGLSSAVATSIHLANAAITWKLSLIYQEDGNGGEAVTGSIYADGGLQLPDLDVCIRKVKSYTFGNIAGLYYADVNVDFEGTYKDSASGNVVTMFWTAAMRFAQDAALNEVHNMVNAPTGYELIPKGPPQTCIPRGGTSINPTSWTFDAWS